VGDEKSLGNSAAIWRGLAFMALISQRRGKKNAVQKNNSQRNND
jgi:hypothetical protein